MSKQQQKDMLTRLDEQIEFFTARRHFSYVGFFEECKKEIEQLRHDLSRAVEREAEHLAEAEQLQYRAKELEAENAELREKIEQASYKLLWSSHPKDKTGFYDAVRGFQALGRSDHELAKEFFVAACAYQIKQQADDEGEA